MTSRLESTTFLASFEIIPSKRFLAYFYLGFAIASVSYTHLKGVKTVFVTLHVGLGTFRPVKADEITEHKMHSEFYVIGQDAADVINETKQSGGRVIAVGTTANRVLETVADEDGDVYKRQI